MSKIASFSTISFRLFFVFLLNARAMKEEGEGSDLLSNVLMIREIKKITIYLNLFMALKRV